MKVSVIYLALSVSISLLSGQSVAKMDGCRGGGDDMMMMHEHKMEKMLDGLSGLTKEQKDKIQAIRMKGKEMMKGKKEQMGKAMEAMGGLMSQDPLPTKEQAKAQHQGIMQVMSEMGDAKFEMHYEMAQVLTAAQRKQMHEGMMKHHQHMMDKKHGKKG